LVTLCFAGLMACSDTRTGEVIAEVGDAVLTRQELDRRVPIHLNGRLTADDRQRMVEAWVEEQLLFQEALTKELDEDPAITRRVDQAVQMILRSELLERSFTAVSTITEDDIQAYYAEHSATFTRDIPEIRVRQVLVKGRSDANRVKKRLDDGGMFDQVALEESIDESAARGGDVGYFTEDRVEPAFWAGCEKAKIGKLTQVRTPLGYHMIEVLDRKDAGSTRDLLDVRDEIRQRILTERREDVRKKLLEEIRNRIPASIKYDRLETSS